MNWEDIRKEYETTNITLKALAEKYGVKLGTLKSRKSREGWSRDATAKKGASKKKKVAKEKDASPKETKEDNPFVETLVESDGLNDKQKLFCIYYLKSFNQTQAAIKAGYSPDRAHVTGSELVRNRKVAAEIRRLKGEMAQGIFIDAMDVLNKYIKIAFADITDFVTFNRRDEETNEMEIQLNEDGTVNDVVPKVQSSNEMYFKDADQIDGTVVSEVKKSKDGLSIKLHDKMRALEKLEKYFDLLPDYHKRKLEEEKSELSKQKHELDKRIVELREREEDKKGW